MNTFTEAVRKHHLSLAKTLEAHVRAVAGDVDSQTEREAFVGFLKGDLLPHWSGEKHHLYGLVDGLVRKHGSPTATMMVDHEFIWDHVAKIQKVSRLLASATCGGLRGHLLHRLRDLTLGLDAIVELHLAKEERIYLPLIEDHVDDERQRDALRAIHESYQKEKNMPEDRPQGAGPDHRNHPACNERRHSRARRSFE
jgi:hypothetical protein